MPDAKRDLEFEQALFAELPVKIGQVTVERDGDAFLLVGPAGTEECMDADMPTEAFRQWIRQTDEGQYRPLSGAKTLRQGWRRRCANLERLLEDLDVIYPLGLLHHKMCSQGRLPIVGPIEILARQGTLKGGMAPVPALVDAVTATLCAGCVRAPVWGEDSTNSGGEIPCPEPCSFWVSLYRLAAGWGEDLPPREPADGSVGFADFSKPGNLVREALLGCLAGRRAASRAERSSA